LLLLSRWKRGKALAKQGAIKALTEEEITRDENGALAPSDPRSGNMREKSGLKVRHMKGLKPILEISCRAGKAYLVFRTARRYAQEGKNRSSGATLGRARPASR